LPGRLTRLIKEGLWFAYSMALHSVSALAIPGTRPRSAGERARVLIAKLDAIGDFVLWLDAAKGYRNLFPEKEYEIVLLGNRVWTPLAEKLPWFDEVWPLGRDRFLFDPLYRLRLLRRVRAGGFRIVVHPSYSREFLRGDSIVRFSGAPERIGSEGDCSNIRPYLKRISDRWYTRLVPATKAPLMELERNAEFLRGLGLKDFKADVPAWPVRSAPCPALSDLGGAEYYILFPGATVALKQWPVENFAEVALGVHRHTGWTGVICGSPAERDLGERLRLSAGVPIVNLAGRTTLPELVAAISGARILIGNDTSGVHIAASVSTPSVCILGGGHYGRFLPYRVEVATARPLPVVMAHRMDCYYCNWECIRNPLKGESAPCVRDIPVDAVWKAVREILDRDAGTPPERNGRIAE
jgi:ADP-heptose:LPS heptosyltransferase